MTRRHVLRARLGITVPDGTDRADAEAIIDYIRQIGGDIDLLQLGPAARPEWADFGPVDRITEHPPPGTPALTSGAVSWRRNRLLGS